MSSILLIRQQSSNYDSPQSLNLGNSIDVVDLFDSGDVEDYLKRHGYKHTFKDNYTANRLVKFLPNPDYEMKIYLDSSILINDVNAFLNSVEQRNDEHFDLMLCEHPNRNVLSDELRACYLSSKISKEQYREFIKSNEILKNAQTLTQNGFMMSRYNENFRYWCNQFVDYLSTYEIKRDQIALPIFLEKTPLKNLNYQSWPSYLTVKKHKKSAIQKVLKKINYISRSLNG